MTLTKAINLIQSTAWKGSQLGLKRMEELMGQLGHQEKKLHFIHVAGSNGKGSVAAMVSSILTAAGYNTGLYISPHLTSYTERMKINNQDIREDRLCELTDMIYPCLEQMEDKPTEFEILTAIAFMYFEQEGCDIVVLETGLGGRLDATNIIPVPEVAVLMNIGLEHTEVLGNTLSDIASEKAGIIKEKGTVVAYRGVTEVEAVFERICLEKAAALHKARFDEATLGEESLDGQTFSWRCYDNLFITLLGKHQVYNAVMALETVELLSEQGWQIEEAAIRNGLINTKWPARMEVLNLEPLFILDGAHNPQGVRTMVDSIQSLLPGKKVVFLLGVLKDKDYSQMIDLILPLACSFFCVTPHSERAMSAEKLADYLRARGAVAEAYDDVVKAIQAALTAANGETAVLTFGSLYLAGTIRESFRIAYRKWIRGKGIRARDSLFPEVREELSHRIVKQILVSPEFKAAKTVMIYRATRGEVRLELLETAPEAQSKRFVYPLCTSSAQMIALQPHSKESWVSGSYNIMEPLPEKSTEVSPMDVDMIICPCTAFDEDCNRVGMGAGYYDRYLVFCENAIITSVAFEIQKVHKVPTEPWDMPMKMIFTDKATYRSGL